MSRKGRKWEMDVLQIIGIGVIGSVAALLLRSQKPEIAFQVAIVTGVVIFLSVSVSLSTAVNSIFALAQKYGVDTGYIGTVIRIIGIAYICQFASEVCRDAGEGAIASKIEFGGKILILLYAIPIIEALLAMIVEILP